MSNNYCYCYIYKVSFYNSTRCTIANTEMYFAREEHTRWAHKHPDARVHVIRCLKASPEWYNAWGNSDQHINWDTKNVDDKLCPLCQNELNHCICRCENCAHKYKDCQFGCYHPDTIL